MNLIIGGRGTGKTTELIKMAVREDKYIICSTRMRAQLIMEQAEKMREDGLINSRTQCRISAAQM